MDDKEKIKDEDRKWVKWLDKNKEIIRKIGLFAGCTSCIFDFCTTCPTGGDNDQTECLCICHYPKVQLAISKTIKSKDEEWIKNLRTNFDATLEKFHIGIPIEILIGVEQNTAKAIFGFEGDWERSETYKKILEHRKDCDRWSKEFCLDCFGGGLTKFTENLRQELKQKCENVEKHKPSQ